MHDPSWQDWGLPFFDGQLLFIFHEGFQANISVYSREVAGDCGQGMQIRHAAFLAVANHYLISSYETHIRDFNLVQLVGMNAFW